MPACAGAGGSNGRPPWASSPFSSVRVSRDQRDEPGGARRCKKDRSVDGNQPSNSVARVWPPRVRRRVPADAGANHASTFTEASYTKYLTFPIAVDAQAH